MKTNFYNRTALALCLVAGLLGFGFSAPAAIDDPDTENCWTASLVVYCNSYESTRCSDGTYSESCRHLILGPPTGWNEGGGPTSGTCNLALHALLVEAAHAGCRVRPGSAHCYHDNDACYGEVPEPESS